MREKKRGRGIGGVRERGEKERCTDEMCSEGIGHDSESKREVRGRRRGALCALRSEGVRVCFRRSKGPSTSLKRWSLAIVKGTLLLMSWCGLLVRVHIVNEAFVRQCV